MSFDRATIARTIARHGPAARVVIAAVAGSAPRETGVAMLVWAGGQSGTIGGGALEFEAIRRARESLQSGTDRVDREALGPGLGQCCGGSVTVLTEIWDQARLDATGDDDPVVRPLPGRQGPEPLAVTRALGAMRSGAAPAGPVLIDGWMIEPVSAPARTLWIYGAGHVGRALVTMAAALPDLAITWVDTDDTRFPGDIPEPATKLVAARPGDVVRFVPPDADHLIMTYSHALDLDLCHRLLAHGFQTAGLIGSKTKWARFRARLRQLGHTEAQIDRIICPIGDPALGKHPQAIAVGVVAALLKEGGVMVPQKSATG